MMLSASTADRLSLLRRSRPTKSRRGTPFGSRAGKVVSAGSSEAVDERPAAIERGREASTEAKLHEWIDQGFGSALLIGATLVSLILANTAFATGWQQLFETEVGPAIWGLHMSLREWINEGVMAIFFFVVGLEIKRELVEGSLSSIRAAALPCIAAAGGMVVPIAVYLAINSVGGGVLSGWSIPMATDIAFAMGVFNAFKSKMPQALSAFLLTLATVDDLGAIFVIAVCFSGKISALFMGLASAATGALFLLDRMRSTNLSLYIALGSTLWYSLLRGGVNADIAGVITAFTFSTHAPAPKVSPAESEVPGKSPSLVDHLIYKMTPYTALLIMPLFALANTCVSVDGKALVSLLSTPIAMGVFCGLVLGKPIGIAGASALAVRLGIARWPAGMSLPSVSMAGMLGGIGFTMSLFLIEQSLTGSMTKSAAKLAILTGSMFAATVAGVMASVLPAQKHQSKVQ